MRKSCLQTIYELAKKNHKIVFIGSDLGPGVLSEFKKKYPKRFFMEGVSEQFIIGMSAGLAKEGFIPYVNTISTFLTRRCFEQIAIDLCLHNLPVKLIGNGGGLVYAPLGPTHQAIEDISILRTLPNMSIIAPCDSVEMKKLIQDTVTLKSPLYVRIAKGGDEILTNEKQKIKFGRGRLMLKPKNCLIISTGVMTQISMKAAKLINRNSSNACGVIHLSTIKPLDKKILLNWIPKIKRVLTIEENVLNGGFGSSIMELIAETSPKDLSKIKRIGLKDRFITNYGSQEELFEKNQLNVKTILEKLNYEI